MITEQKKILLEKLSNENGIISALAIDQRGALKKMMNKYREEEATSEQIKNFKILVSRELTKYSSSILLDPEYGLEAAEIKDKNAGLLLAYEKTGYDTNSAGRLPDSLSLWSVKRLKEKGADAVKFLLYYDVDETEKINNKKKAYMERVGSECLAEDIPFFLEILTYDSKIQDNSSTEFAKVKPRKVIEAMKVFSDKRYNVDVLKVEVPVNMNFVEGFCENKVIYTKKEAEEFFRKQNKVSDLPYIYLSAGVSAKLFQETLKFAHNAGAEFNGVLCGRATWAEGVEIFSKYGENKTVEWLNSTGRKNIEELNEVLKTTAISWKNKLK
ncbi:MAG: tagatose-bisphosphate aldolase [Leptotrichiaceae bacterium]|nr:tagatose-bisphosphate aldolase [Leptotrichiaceae bacterium]